MVVLGTAAVSFERGTPLAWDALSPSIASDSCGHLLHRGATTSLCGSTVDLFPLFFVVSLPAFVIGMMRQKILHGVYPGKLIFL